MKLREKAEAYARIGLVAEKAGDDLAAQLDRWFAKWLIKGVKLTTLRALSDARAYAAFSEALANCSDKDALAIVKKLDPSNRDILSKERAAIERHVAALADRRIEPLGKPVRKKPPISPKKPPRAGGAVTNARQG